MERSLRSTRQGRDTLDGAINFALLPASLHARYLLLAQLGPLLRSALVPLLGMHQTSAPTDYGDIYE